MPQQFEHLRNTKGKSIERTVVGPRENPDNYPVIPFDMVQRIYDISQAKQISHRKVFLSLFDRKKLSDAQIEVLSTAPDVYTAGPREEDLRAGDAERAAKAKAFLDEVDRETKAQKVEKTIKAG